MLPFHYDTYLQHKFISVYSAIKDGGQRVASGADYFLTRLHGSLEPDHYIRLTERRHTSL